MLLTTSLLFFLSAAAPPAGVAAQEVEAPQASLAQMRGFILDKLAYDAEYFEKVVAARSQGRSLPGLKAAAMQKEATRATRALPVLRRFVKERATFEQGTPLSLPTDAVTFKEYRNLLGLLNMFQAHQRNDAQAVVDIGGGMNVKTAEDFGRVRGASADYYVSMFRAYFYLMGSGHFARGRDAQAVSWFARLEGDATLAALKGSLEAASDAPADVAARRREALRQRPVAVLPLENLTGDASRDYLGPSLSELLTGDLAQTSDLVVVERGQLAKVMDETALSLAGITRPEIAQRAGDKLGAGSVIVGSLNAASANTVTIALRLVGTDDAADAVLGAASETVAVDDVFRGARDCLLALLRSVGWGDAVLQDELLARHAPATSTAQMLFQARLLRATKSEEAKALYAKAIREDPALANLYADLKAEFKDVAATLAVLSFVNVSGRADDAWMATGVQEALSADLPRLGFSVVERARIDDVLLSQGTVVDGGAASAVGGMLNADYTVLGSVLHQAPTIRVDLRVVEVKTGVIAFSTAAEDKRDDLPMVLRLLTSQLAERFNAPLGEDDLDALVASSATPAEFEKAMRARLAAQTLRAAQRREALAEESATATPPAPLPIVPIAGAVAIAAGLVTAGAGVALAMPEAGRARELNALAAVASTASQPALLSARDDAALLANVYAGLAWVGGAVAAAGAAALVADAFFDDEEPPSQEAPGVAVAAGGR